MTAAVSAVPGVAEAPPIPFVDLAGQDAEVRAEVESGFRRVMDSSAFIQGPDVEQFETAYARWTGIAHCIGAANGTDALELALRAAGIGAGDEVLLPTNSFVATAEAVVRAGAEPCFVDIDPVHHLIDPEAAAARVTRRTRALLPVHLYGQMAPMAALRSLADAHDLLIIEDAAQAQGAVQSGDGPGARSAAAATSFYPGKNLGAYGDAGAVLTRDAELAARIRCLGNHGSTRRYEHTEIGWNSRLDTLQAVVLLAKLSRLTAWNAARSAAAGRYDELLDSLPEVSRPSAAPGNAHVWHLYVLQVPDRDAVLGRLQRAGIGAGIHYPIPIHLQRAFAHLGHRRGDFPIAEAVAERLLSLPVSPHITAAQQERVADELRRALR